MEVLFATPLLLVPFFWPIITGILAGNNGRKFWTWFFIGIPLPLIAAVILLFLPDKSKPKIAGPASPVENDEIFNHLFNKQQEKQIINHESHFSATA